MKTKIYMLSGSTAAEKNLLTAFGQGIRLHWEREHGKIAVFDHFSRIGRWSHCLEDKSLEYVYDDFYTECDVAVIFGSWKPRDKGSHVTRNSVATQAKRFVVIETPLINRRTHGSNDHWRIGVNGFLNAAAEWPVLTVAEADRRLAKWDVKWAGWQRNPDGHVVLVLQLPGDASLRGQDINDWAYHAVIEIRRHSQRSITIRNHPLCSNRAFADHEVVAAKLALSGVSNIKFSDGYFVPWQQDLEGAWCTVTYTSGLAIDSVLAGVPTVTCDPGNFAWGISSQSLSDIEKPVRANNQTVHSWLRQLAGCQWSEDEIRSGLAWQYLKTILDSMP
jgi:hypothetical protein